MARVVLLFLLFLPVFAVAEQGPEVLIRVSGERSRVGEAWVLTLLTRHADPNGVSVEPPGFAAGLEPELVRQGPRLMPDGGLWTFTEYRFLPDRPGSFAFGPFAVTVSGSRSLTEPFTLEVSGTEPDLPGFSLAWVRLPSALTVGESAVLALSLPSDPGTAALPSPDILMPPVPPGSILESMPPEPGLAMKLRVLPLEAGEFTLEARTVIHAGYSFRVPGLRLPVLPPAADPAAAVRPAPVPGTSSRLAEPEIFPAFPPEDRALALQGRLDAAGLAEFRNIYLQARNFWEDRQIAEALALLRRHERDHPAGAMLAHVRREAENAAGLLPAGDERRGLRLPFLGPQGPNVVLRETELRSVPDEAAGELRRFAEGQAARAGRRSREWIWVQVPGIASGWVKAEKVIFY
ncbi:MAG: hypothetical protein FWD94_02020 [Treponema sp.]|nr:hypothetical protein [Treponema sp.]